MKCPYCATENRDDREVCYHCGKDLSMLRLIVNKARHHYNIALEHAERQRYPEALVELEHCLELDHSFVPAHVVMGTVYAKMEKFDEAGRCWRAALELDPHVQKAHEYMDKSRLARRAGPLLRRFHWAIGLAAAVAVLFLVLIVWQLRPTFDRIEMERITSEIDKGNYGAAFEVAQHLENAARRLEVRRAARLLEYTIGERYESAALDMVTLLLEDKPLEAHELYQRLTQGHQPPDPYNRQLLSLDRKAGDRAATLAESWCRQFSEGTRAYSELDQKLARFREAFSGQKETVEKVNGLLAAARRKWVAATLAQLPTSAPSTTQTLTWLERLNDVAKAAPERRDEVSSATKRLLAAAAGPMEQKLTRAVTAKHAAAVRSELRDLESLVFFGPSEALTNLIKKARADLRRLESDPFKARLSAATGADIPQLDAWIASFEKATSVTAANDAEVSAVLTRAKRRLAAEVVNWCNERDTRFEKGQSTKEEARWIADRAEFALRYSAAKNWRYSRDTVMFCAAVAWTQLGNRPQAAQWITRLEKAYPESSFVAAARRLRPRTPPKKP